MPATAAIDNETLDHLLSVVKGGISIGEHGRFGRAFVRPHLTSSRIARSKPSKVSGYIRPPMSCRTMAME